MAPNMTDYMATRQSFQLQVPGRFNWAFDTFDRWARDSAKLALLWVAADGQPRRFTYAELGERSRRFANALGALGVTAGERVFVMLPRVYQWWEIILGCIRARVVSVPGTTLLTPKDIEYRLNLAAASVVITGKFWLDNTPDDLHWTISDTGWAQAAWTCCFAPWNMGAALFVWDARGKKFEPGETLSMFERFPITTFFAPPTAYRMLVQEPLKKYRFPMLRHCLGAGEAVNPEVIEAWRDGTGHHIYEGYGQTETVLLAATFPATPWKPGSMGPAAPGHTVAIVDDEGREVDRGAEGDIAVRVAPERPV